MKIDIDKINWIRIEMGLSLTELGKKSGLSKSTMTRIFNNRATSRPDTIGKIAKTLNIPVQDLFINE